MNALQRRERPADWAGRIAKTFRQSVSQFRFYSTAIEISLGVGIAGYLGAMVALRWIA